MTLIDHVRRVLGEPEAGSFQLAGEELVLITGAALREAAAEYAERLAADVPAGLRAAFEAEQAGMAERARRWLHRYNRSLNGRVRGYLALGRLVRFQYPWPVVAILGICQVDAGIGRTRLYGLAGRVGTRLGLAALERATDGAEDVLRRTNRGIFADSVPTVLYALRCHDLRAAGRADLAAALLGGPLPPWMDEESRTVASGLYESLAIASAPARFRRLADLTRRHFEREQAIFTHHLGASRSRPPARAGSRLGRWLTEPRSVPAPTVERNGKAAGRIAFLPYRLPPGFDMRDHAARVRAFGHAFVSSVTASLEDYRVAVEYVVQRFGRGAKTTPLDFRDGPVRPTDAVDW